LNAPLPIAKALWPTPTTPPRTQPNSTPRTYEY
jgi:hypothetical protein